MISVDREADKYIVEYTYGDYYSHDAVKKCEITVGNDGLIISDIMEYSIRKFINKSLDLDRLFFSEDSCFY